MPSKVIAASANGRFHSFFRHLRIIVAFAATTLASYCSVTGMSHNAGDRGANVATHGKGTAQ
jgi:hypothetical protein